MADAKMRSFNRDGSEGQMAGNNLRCVAKYLYDKGYVRSEHISVETGSGVKYLKLFIRDGSGQLCGRGHGPGQLATPPTCLCTCRWAL